MKLKLLRPVHKDHPISSPFGWRKLPSSEFHKGIDFAVPVGTEVTSFSSGVCFKMGWEKGPEFGSEHQKMGLGLRVWQEFDYHGITMYGWYGHLSKIFVEPYSQIKPGQLIGLSGNTGRSTGPHLHVQFRAKDSSDFVDVDWMNPDELND